VGHVKFVEQSGSVGKSKDRIGHPDWRRVFDEGRGCNQLH